MAKKRFFVDIDLSHNQLLNAVLHTGGTAALASVLTIAGSIGFDTDLQQMVYKSGSTVRHLIAGTEDFATNIATDEYAASVKAVYDYYKSSGATGGAGEISIEDTNGYFSSANVEGALQEIGAALNAVNSSMQVVGNIGATSGGADWPYPAGAQKGDAYVVTGATVTDYATVGVANLHTTAGSLVVCNLASGTTDADWFILDARREPSSATIRGIIALATQAEVNAGTEDTKAITALKLKAYMQEISGTTIYTAHSVTLASGTPAVATHNLGDDVTVQVWLRDTPIEDITSGVALTKATNAATVTVNSNPGFAVDIVCVGNIKFPA